MTTSQRLSAPGWPRPLIRLVTLAWFAVFASNLLGASGPVASLGPVAWALSWSGSRMALPWLAIAASLWLPSRRGRPLARRALESLVVALGFTLFLGAGGAANEWVIKPALAIPRPSVRALAQAGALPEGVDAFYALPSASERRARLEAVLAPATVTAAPSDPRARGEWAAMVGYSFPSGHAFASMAFATLCAGLALILRPPGWRAVAWGLPAWAALVSWSRPIIGVHTPIDVTAGAGEGLLLGLLGFWLTRAALRRVARTDFTKQHPAPGTENP